MDSTRRRTVMGNVDYFMYGVFVGHDIVLVTPTEEVAGQYKKHLCCDGVFGRKEVRVTKVPVYNTFVGE